MTIGMKKIMSYVLVLVFDHAFANAESTGLFPMSDITVGMSAKEMLEKYPSGKSLGALDFGDNSPRLTNDQNETYLVFYDIPRNKFWDSLTVSIVDAKVKGLGYAYLNKELLLSGSLKYDHDFDEIVKSIKPLFKQLKNELGPTFEQNILYTDFGQAEVRSAMYVWKREKDVVVFYHTPVALYKKGDNFECQLTIVPTIEAFSDIMATDSLSEDALLWADAMGEEREAFPNLWVYACVALCVFCAIAYFIRKKRQ